MKYFIYAPKYLGVFNEDTKSMEAMPPWFTSTHRKKTLGWFRNITYLWNRNDAYPFEQITYSGYADPSTFLIHSNRYYIFKLKPFRKIISDKKYIEVLSLFAFSILIGIFGFRDIILKKLPYMPIVSSSIVEGDFWYTFRKKSRLYEKIPKSILFSKLEKGGYTIILPYSSLKKPQHFLRPPERNSR